MVNTTMVFRCENSEHFHIFSSENGTHFQGLSDPTILITATDFRSSNSERFQDFQNNVHFQDQNLRHVFQSSYSETLKSEDMGGEAPRKSREVWVAATTIVKVGELGKIVNRAMLFFLPGRMFAATICKLLSKFGNLVGLLEPSRVLSERQD